MNNDAQIVFAGGCFWCTEAVFQQVKGVNKIISGYTGGFIKNPCYREVCNGTTGHAEGILITYSPELVSLENLLAVFFATHDPTTLNRQGNDVGTQYRSEIFYTTEDQKKTCENYIKQLQSEKVFSQPIVTKVTLLDKFYEAEIYHQNYYNQNKEAPYCSFVITPKVNKTLTHFKSILKE